MYVTNVSVTSELTDLTGNVFVLGTYTGTGTIFAGSTSVYTTAGSVYLFKMSPVTGLLWAYGITGSPGTVPLSIDSGSNVCVGLNTSGTFNVFTQGGTPVYQNTTISYPASFLFKFSSTGSIVAQGLSATPITIPADPIYSSVSLLVHGNSSLADSSQYNASFTNSGLTFTSSNPGVSGGTGSINISTGSATASLVNNQYSPVNTSWTVEFWLNIVSASSPFAFIIGSFSTGLAGEWFIDLTGTNIKFNIVNDSQSGINVINVYGQLTTGTWYHIAFQRSGSSLYCYINGVQKQTATISSFTTFTSVPFQIAPPFGSTGTTYLYDLRITNAVRYPIAGFTPPTTQFTTVPYYIYPSVSNIQLVTTSFDAAGNLWALGNQYGYTSILNQNLTPLLTAAPISGTPGQLLGVQMNQAMAPQNYVQITNAFVQNSTSEGVNVYAVSNSIGLSNYYYLNGTKTASLLGPGTNVTSMFQLSGSPWSISANSTSANGFTVVAGSNVYLASSIGSLRTVYQGSTLNTTLPALTGSVGTSVTRVNFQGAIQSINFFDGATCNTAPNSDPFLNVYLSLKSQSATVTLKNSTGTVLTTLTVGQGNNFVAKTTTSAVIGQTIFGDYLNPNPVQVSYSNGLTYSYQQYQDTTGNLTNEIGTLIGSNPLGTANTNINTLYSTIGTSLLLDVSSNLSLGTNLVATTGSLRVVGNIVSTGDVTGFSQLSDRRLKTDLQPLSNCLDLVMGLNPVEFTWNEQEINWYRQGQRDIGLIAQEVPKIVTGEFDGYRTVRYDRLVPYLIGAIQELGLRLNP